MIIKPANRTNSVSEYYFSKKLQEIDLMNRQGAEVINLGIGAPDRMPPEEAILTLIKEAQHPGNHAYQSYKGIKELREGFATWYKKYYRVDLNPDTEIQPLAGSKEGILLLSLAFLNKGDFPAYRRGTAPPAGCTTGCFPDWPPPEPTRR